jgi:exosortase
MNNEMTATPKLQLSLTDWAFVFALVCLAPMLWVQCMSLWSRPHFQFFPMAWLSFGYFAYHRLGGLASCRSSLRLAAGAFLALFCVVASAESILISSPWLAYAAGVGLVVAWLLLRGNNLRWPAAVGLSSVLWMTLPFPAGYDDKLIQFLQRQSSYFTSVILDCIGILHLPEGNVLELSQKRLFVDEACSGVDSLYALMAICLCLVLWFRQRLFVAVISLSLVPVWASCGNIVRLVTIVLGLEWIGIDLSHGTQHTILGLMVFAGAFSCDFAFIQFAGAVFKRKSPSTDGSRRSANTGLVDSEKPEGLRPASNKIKQLAPILANVVFMLMFLGIGTFSVQILARNTLQTYPTIDKAALATVKENQNLPRRLEDWQVEGFQNLERSRESSQGQFSNVWTYRSAVGPVLVSTDFPFRGFHLLDICYQGAGWRLSTATRQIEQTYAGSNADANGVFYPHVMELTNDEGKFAYILYAIFQLDGTPIRSAAKGVQGFERFEQTILEPVSFQIQIMMEASEPIDQTQRDVAHRNLLTVVNQLRTSFQSLKVGNKSASAAAVANAK